MPAAAATRALLRQRLEQPPGPDDRPGGLGLLAVVVACPPGEAARTLAAAHADLLACARGTADAEDLPELEADWMLWSMATDGPDRLRLWLEITGYPVSGFSSLRRFFLARGARSVEQDHAQ